MEKEILRGIYNTLLLIETKGESSLMMADCIRAMQPLLVQRGVQDEQRNEDQNNTGDSDIA